MTLGCAAPDAPRVTHLELLLPDAVYVNEDLPDVRPTVEMIRRGVAWRPTIATLSPSKLAFPVTVPDGGRLDVSMTMDDRAESVTFRVVIEGSRRHVAFEGELNQAVDWVSREIDLSDFAGQAVTLSLETEAPVAGTSAYWGAPIVSGGAPAEQPNVILYIIDAAGADFMSVYGHEPTNTPFLEELAAQGAVFERAYSNSTWTKISTPSFLSSLHSSVLGGHVSREDVISDSVLTLPQILRQAGYTTAEITSNPFAGMMTGLERGLDYLRDGGVARNAVSSAELHANLRQWRSAADVRPYWAHVQTTDVHWPWDPEPPHLGTFTDAAERETFYRDELRLADAAGLDRPQWLHVWRYPQRLFDELGIDRQEFFSVADRLYDESMLHNDEQLRQLVSALEANGDWDNTILIVASDHSSAHGLGLEDDILDRDGPIMNSMRTRIPLMVVWPGRIQAQRIEAPVSMVDVLPTVLDLAGLPAAEVTQGQSWGPVLRGEPWEPHLVTLDEMYVEEDGTVSGWLEVIEGRWGASWRFRGRTPADTVPGAEVRLCDLPADPLCRYDVAGEHPDHVARLAEQLQERWAASWILAAGFGRGDRGEMTEEQRRALRALGYIQ